MVESFFIWFRYSTNIPLCDTNVRRQWGITKQVTHNILPINAVRPTDMRAESIS